MNPLDMVNVRRMMLFIKDSLASITESHVFDTIDASDVQTSITSYLKSIKGRGAITNFNASPIETCLSTSMHRGLKHIPLQDKTYKATAHFSEGSMMVKIVSGISWRRAKKKLMKWRQDMAIVVIANVLVTPRVSVDYVKIPNTTVDNTNEI